MNATTWTAALATYADHLAEHHTADTAAGYLRAARRLANSFPDTSPDQLTAARLAAWYGAQNWSRTTRHHMVAAWRSFYRHLIATGQASRSPVAGLPVQTMPPGPQQRRVPAPWADPIDGYLVNVRAGGRSPGTVGVYSSLLRNLADTYPDPWLVTDDDLTAWIGRPDLSPQSKKIRRSLARGFYAWAVRTGRTTANPAAGLPTVRVPRGLPRPITNPALLEALHRADDRQRTIMLLAALAGLRRAEIAGLRWEDWTGDQLTIRGKGGSFRRVPVHPELAEALTAWRDAGGGRPVPRLCGYVFASSTRPGQPLTPPHLAKLLQGALPTGWTLHQLRHRFASTAYAAQRDLRAVQELLGHQKPETTARYAAVPDNAVAAAVASVGILGRPSPAPAATRPVVAAWQASPAGLDGHRWPCPRAQSEDADCTDQGCQQ